MNNKISRRWMGSGAKHPALAPRENAFGPAPARSLLAEMLAWQETMLVQLQLELLGVVHNAGFLSDLIAQHEKTVRALRFALEKQPANVAVSDLIVITGEASCAPAKSRITRSAQGGSTTNSVSNQMTVRRSGARR